MSAPTFGELIERIETIIEDLDALAAQGGPVSSVERVEQMASDLRWALGEEEAEA